MQVLADVRLLIWEGASAWMVDALPVDRRAARQTDVHAHHAIQLTIGLGGNFHITSGSQTVQGRAIAIAPDISHALEAEGRIAIIFIEPESRLGRRLVRTLFPDASVTVVNNGCADELIARFDAACRAGSDKARMIAAISQGIAALGGDTHAPAPDLRVRKLIAWVDANLDNPLSLADATAVCGLSASRLRHLFVEQTGLQFRTYLLWQRLGRAVALLAENTPLSQAAHQAGFADQAHMSRTFRRMFGVAPTNLRIC